MRYKGLILLAFLLFPAACAYRGGGDDPAVRKFTLFSMLNGDDIRGKCGSSPGFERYRIVYNGLYEEQFRVYELVKGARDGNVLKASVSTPGNVAEFKLDDLLSPWRPRTSERFLSDQEFAGLVLALTESGFNKPSPRGLSFTSDSFWWLAVGCRNGQTFFQVWVSPETDLMKLPLAKPVLALDGTGVPLNLPRHPISNLPPMKSSADDRRFTLKVGENGLAGGSSVF